MRLACAEDFYNGPIYTDYRHHEGYAKRAALFQDFPEPICIVGCGFGFLVQELLKLEKDCWGIDASPYAIENRVTDRVLLGNILDFTPEARTLITEDMLPYLTDQEARIAAKRCGAKGAIVVHLVTESGEADLNYHSLIYWTQLTHQLTVSLEGM